MVQPWQEFLCLACDELHDHSDMKDSGRKDSEGQPIFTCPKCNKDLVHLQSFLVYGMEAGYPLNQWLKWAQSEEAQKYRSD